MANQEIIALLKKYLTLLKAEGISVEKAILYGSYSSNTATESSDIDLMIVTNDRDANDDFIIGKIWSLTRKINTRIEPFLISSERFNQNTDSPLVDLIKSKGVEIVQQ